MAKKVFLMICLVACMTVIFMFSSQNGAVSGNLSGGVTETLARIFIDGFEELSSEKQKEIVEGMHFYIRKAAHFSIYAVLGFFSCLNSGLYIKRKKTAASASAGFCLVYAATDELHQLFTDGRCGSPVDVLIDFSGSLTGIAAACLLVYLIGKRRKA
jgi:VanZ family protein